MLCTCASSRQAGQDAALRQEGLEQEDQEGRQGRPIAVRRGQVHPEGPTGHVSRSVRMAYGCRRLFGAQLNGARSDTCLRAVMNAVSPRKYFRQSDSSE